LKEGGLQPYYGCWVYGEWKDGEPAMEEVDENVFVEALPRNGFSSLEIE